MEVPLSWCIGLPVHRSVQLIQEVLVVGPLRNSLQGNVVLRDAHVDGAWSLSVRLSLKKGGLAVAID